MILAALIAAQPAPPAPFAPPIDWNYQVDCRVFAPDGSSDRISGGFVFTNRYRASASLASASGRYPFNPPGSVVPILGPGEMVVKANHFDTGYTYFFNLPSGAASGNGTLRVSASTGQGEMNWVATGICAVSRTRAESQ
jgi:hypothetical protein